jgi:hypothetical protein
VKEREDVETRIISRKNNAIHFFFLFFHPHLPTSSSSSETSESETGNKFEL